MLETVHTTGRLLPKALPVPTTVMKCADCETASTKMQQANALQIYARKVVVLQQAQYLNMVLKCASAPNDTWLSCETCSSTVCSEGEAPSNTPGETKIANVEKQCSCDGGSRAKGKQDVDLQMHEL